LGCYGRNIWSISNTGCFDAKGKRPEMRKPQTLILLGAVIVISACSAETARRTTYETLQNIEEAQCQKEFSADCPDRESFDAYKRKKRDNETDQH
jgi:hypothetical protein